MTLKRGRVEAGLCGSHPSGYDHISSRENFNGCMHTVNVTYSAFRMIDDGRSRHIRAVGLKYILSGGILSVGIALP